MYYDIDGKPISLEQWARLFEDNGYRRIAWDELDNGYEISTVWLGLDHSFLGDTKQIFETMVFGGEGSEDMRRYSSKEGAAKGHLEMVDKWKGGSLLERTIKPGYKDIP